MAIRCFISYRWDEKQAEFARLLASRLSRFQDIEAWIDVEQFQIGVNLHNWLEQGIDKQSDLFIPILTPEYLAGNTCQKELAHAVKLANKSNKPILPIVISDCDIPLILGDVTWGDFRYIFDDAERIVSTKFAEALKTLVKSIRFHASRSSRLQRIKSSAVRRPDDLRTHLILRIYNEAVHWQSIDRFFSLYCDISDDRGFKLPPSQGFRKHLDELITYGYVLASVEKVSVQHGKHLAENVPERVKISPAGASHVRDADVERHRAGI